jgi:hypothetical protein
MPPLRTGERPPLYRRTFWLTSEQRRELITKAKGKPPTSEADMRELVEQLRDDKQRLADRIVSTILPKFIKDQAELDQIANRITSDTVISRIVRAQ